jgi:hypothetical protein
MLVGGLFSCDPEVTDGLDAGAAPTDSGAVHFDWTAGDYPPDLHGQTYLEITGVRGQAGKTRQYKVHVPGSYRPDTPVLFAFHDYFQNAVMFVVDGTNLVSKSEQEGFILVMPNGLQEEFVGGSWNGGTCCGEAASQYLGDVALIRAIYAELREHLNRAADTVGLAIRAAGPVLPASAISSSATAATSWMPRMPRGIS